MGKEEAAGAANGVALRGDLSVGASGVVIAGARCGGRGRLLGGVVGRERPLPPRGEVPGGSAAGVARGVPEAVGGSRGLTPGPGRVATRLLRGRGAGPPARSGWSGAKLGGGLGAPGSRCPSAPLSVQRELALAPIWPLRPGDGPVRVSPSRAARLRNVCAEERSPAASYPGAAAALSPHMPRSLPRPHIASRFETDFPASAEDFLLSSTNF